MTIKTRVTKAQETAQSHLTYRIYRRDAFYSVYTVAGSHSTYQTFLDWQKEQGSIEDVNFLQVNCKCLEHTEKGMEDCKGNNKTVCYHSMAAIIKAASDKGQKVYFFDNFSQALNYSKLGGKLVKVQSEQGNKSYGWIVVKENKTTKSLDNYIENANRKLDASARVNLMRGEIENGIN